MSQNLNNQSGGAHVLDLTLEALRLANALTPNVAAVISIVKKGREQGKDDDAIKAESQAINDATIAEADRQLGVRPNEASDD